MVTDFANIEAAEVKSDLTACWQGVPQLSSEYEFALELLKDFSSSAAE